MVDEVPDGRVHGIAEAAVPWGGRRERSSVKAPPKAPEGAFSVKPEGLSRVFSGTVRLVRLGGL